MLTINNKYNYDKSMQPVYTIQFTLYHVKFSKKWLCCCQLVSVLAYCCRPNIGTIHFSLMFESTYFLYYTYYNQYFFTLTMEKGVACSFLKLSTESAVTLSTEHLYHETQLKEKFRKFLNVIC